MEYVFLDNVSSTQDFVKERLRDRFLDSLVMAKTQELGRGRRDRKWCSPAGGLWFSFDTPYTDELITIAIGVAVREVCSEAYECELLLKWPNDLILDGKKVGGILCEKVENRVVIGVGINTNVGSIGVDNSVSFFSRFGKIIDNEALMKKIVDKFFSLNGENVIVKFRENMAFIGEEKFVSVLNKSVKIVGISDEGHLIIEDCGEVKNVFVGEILIDKS